MNQCRGTETHILGGLLGPMDYFTNLGGGRDGIFLISRHSNVMFSLEVTPPCSCGKKKNNIVCSFLFSYNQLALLTNVMTTKRNCTKLQEEKCENFLWKKTTLEFSVIFFWNCIAYVKHVYHLQYKSCAIIAVPDVSNLD